MDAFADTIYTAISANFKVGLQKPRNIWTCEYGPLMNRHFFFLSLAQNRSVLELNATWQKGNTAAVMWQSVYGHRFDLSVRRAKYETGKISFGKWRKAALNFIAIRMETDSSQDLTDDGYIASEPRASFIAELGLVRDLSYEIRLVEVHSRGESNITASVFLDAYEELAFGE